ncbi:MAG: hypothetical protein AAF802_05835 [Planctomycetota bacterium]
MSQKWFDELPTIREQQNVRAAIGAFGSASSAEPQVRQFLGVMPQMIALRAPSAVPLID